MGPAQLLADLYSSKGTSIIAKQGRLPLGQAVARPPAQQGTGQTRASTQMHGRPPANQRGLFPKQKGLHHPGMTWIQTAPQAWGRWLAQAGEQAQAQALRLAYYEL